MDAGLLVAEGYIAVEIQRSEIPLRILEYGLSIVCVAESELDRLLRSCGCDPRRPTPRPRLGTRRIAWINLRARAWILWAGVNLPQRFHLRRGEALGSIAGFAREDGRIELAY